VGGSNPLLLNSTVERDNIQMKVDLTTADLIDNQGQQVVKGTVHLFRAKLLWKGVQYERLRVSNYGNTHLQFPATFEFGMDGADIFEVRGLKRARRGDLLDNRVDNGDFLMAYRGLDGRVRRTRVRIAGDAPHPFPAESRIQLTFDLAPRASADCFMAIACELDDEVAELLDYEDARRRATRVWRRSARQVADAVSSSEQINELTQRAAADLLMLNTAKPHGGYPYAGVPWFSTPFGRDGIITALQNLWRDPGTAKAVLAFLARHQAREDDPARDAEPGKILHELREGEMATLREIPYHAYYGAADGTPLFLMLAGAYFRRTGDRAFLQRLWPHLEAALTWIDRYGDSDGDGFVEYERRSVNGIVQQGWKDSDDSVFPQDGSDAPMPVALCEVQGYVYAAKNEIASVAAAFGKSALSERLRREASELKRKFDRQFWCQDIGTYAIALDGNKKPCRVRSSNAGQALYTGIALPRRAALVARTLLSEESFSGWGVRTLASSEARYNPMAYHNGSVWPHDNGIIAVGLARYGFHDEAMRIITGLLDARLSLEPKRLPELFCGFKRVDAQHPTLYPVACSPQAWASGAVFNLIQAALGMRFSLSKPQLRFHQPMLPASMHKLEIFNLGLPDGTVDLAFWRHPRDVGFNVLRKSGNIEVALTV